VIGGKNCKKMGERTSKKHQKRAGGKTHRKQKKETGKKIRGVNGKDSFELAV